MQVPTTKKELQKSANLFLISGLIVALIGRVLAMPENSLGILLFGVLVAVAGTVLWVIGCMRYAMSKGQNKWLGLLGLVGCIGLIILAVLPDQWRGDAPPPQSPTNYPRPPQA